ERRGAAEARAREISQHRGNFSPRSLFESRSFRLQRTECWPVTCTLVRRRENSNGQDRNRHNADRVGVQVEPPWFSTGWHRRGAATRERLGVYQDRGASQAL